MNWLDFVIIGIFIIAVIIEARRGFGKALFDFAALLVVIWGMSHIEPLWHSANYPLRDQALIYAGTFLFIGGLLIAIGRLGYQSTLISIPPFDCLLGAMLGVGTAIVLCYGTVHAIALTSGPHTLPAVVTCSALGQEFITFDLYHRVLYVLYHFDNARPNPG